VFQEESTFPWRNVVDNVAFPLEIAGMAKRERIERARHFVSMVGLDGFEKRYPSELSGGMRQRVSMARTLASEPKILLMDEPFAALDEITRFRLNDDLLALWRNLRKTVIFVTHSVFESVYLSQRVIVMTPRPGRIGGEFRIDAPEPRGEDFRTSAGYAAQCREVSMALAQTGRGMALS
jgi:NitT/TauT family transport system ATP-binding protein